MRLQTTIDSFLSPSENLLALAPALGSNLAGSETLLAPPGGHAALPAYVGVNRLAPRVLDSGEY